MYFQDKITHIFFLHIYRHKIYEHNVNNFFQRFLSSGSDKPSLVRVIIQALFLIRFQINNYTTEWNLNIWGVSDTWLSFFSFINLFSPPYRFLFLGQAAQWLWEIKTVVLSWSSSLSSQAVEVGDQSWCNQQQIIQTTLQKLT